ncbi:hypothetical protein GY45DRAFT_189218 [Cubamyces sp. BRFM 1775]|nr:hypothetical protein GY45DRAFT_189218 [Cubamyces sp. BRFM 1775]
MARKRKQTPQSSTLLDFFGKGLTGSTAKTVKKARLTDPATSKQNLAKVCVANPEDIIVIDSDDDEVICVSPRPGSKPLQVHAAMPPRSKTRVQEVADPRSGELSAHACPPEEPPGTDALAGGVMKVKSEPQDVPPPLTSVDTPTHSTRDVSPFGYPALLVPKDVDGAVGPPPTALNECSHDEESSLQVDTLTQVVGALAETAEWNMGDDELEFIDVETRVKPEVSEEVDIDLTIDGEDLPVDDNGSVESCPVCTKRLHGLTVQVRLSNPSLLHSPHNVH